MRESAERWCLCILFDALQSQQRLLGKGGVKESRDVLVRDLTAVRFSDPFR